MAYPQPVRKPPRSTTSKAILVIVAIAMVGVMAVGGLVLVARNREYPSEWDPQVADLASFVERERKLQFDHPVYVDFMTEEDFKERVSTPTSAPSAEQNEELKEAAELFRAFGLLQGEVNLLEQQNQLRQGGTLALYDPKTKRVHVRGTEMDVAHKVTIVHELTHALQDQHFDLKRLTKLPTEDERSAFRTVIEGDAVRIEKKYVDQLPEATQTQYKEQEKKDSDDARKDVSSVPDVLVASFSAPYAFGTPFLESLEAKGGTAEVDQAIKAPPKGQGQIMDPQDYFQKRSIVDVKEPTVPAGATKVGTADQTSEGEDQTDHLGVLNYFMMLSARVDPHQALKAADHWNGDAMVSYRDQGKLCAKVDVAVDDAAAADTVAPILDEWKRDMPTEAGATVDRSGERFAITTCDPGAAADAKIEGKPSQVFSLPAARLYIFASALEAKVPLARADCVAKSFTDSLSIEDATSDTANSDAIKDKLTAAKDACP